MKRLMLLDGHSVGPFQGLSMQPIRGESWERCDVWQVFDMIDVHGSMVYIWYNVYII